MADTSKSRVSLAGYMAIGFGSFAAAGLLLLLLAPSSPVGAMMLSLGAPIAIAILVGRRLGRSSLAKPMLALIIVGILVVGALAVWWSATALRDLVA